MYGMKGQSFMESLKRRIEKDGVVIGDSVIKVDSFLNHQMDIAFLKEVGAEFAKRFSDVKVDKILTIEASGIGLMRVRSSGSDRNGLLTPAWLFYGDYYM